MPVTGGLTFKTVSAGKLHTCALDSTGQAYCWGRNSDGQLGDGSTNTSNVPVPVSGPPFIAIAAGTSHTCGLTSAGVLYCWGKNDKGQLGTGNTASINSPTAVAGGLQFASVSVGENHTCGVTKDPVTLSPSPLVYCWGDNQFGQLGDGTLTDRPAPTKVAFQQ